MITIPENKSPILACNKEALETLYGLKHISFSSLRIWLECPHKFKLTKMGLSEEEIIILADMVKLSVDELGEMIKEFEFNGNIHTGFGTAIHYTNEMGFKLYKDTGRKPSEAFSIEVYKASFESEMDKLEKLGMDISEKEIFYEQGLNMVPKIMPAVFDYVGDDLEVVDIEMDLDTMFTGYLYDDVLTTKLSKLLPFKGFIDLVLYSPSKNKYYIFDWKTCSWGWGKDKKQNFNYLIQLILYKYYFAKRMGFDEKMFRKIELDFVLLKRTVVKKPVEFFKVSAGEKTIRKALDKVNRLCFNLENKKYMKNRLDCHWCPAKGTALCRK